MDAVYRNPDGSFSDIPQPGGVRIDKGAPRTVERPRQTVSQAGDYDHARTTEYIKAAQTAIPRLSEYWDYLEYLATHHRFRFDRIMDDLARKNPRAWMEMSRHPEFQSLFSRLKRLDMLEGHLALGIGVVSGNSTAGMDQWLNFTLKKNDARRPFRSIFRRIVAGNAGPKGTAAY